MSLMRSIRLVQSRLAQQKSFQIRLLSTSRFQLQTKVSQQTSLENEKYAGSAAHQKALKEKKESNDKKDDLSLLDDAYKKYEKISYNSIESTYLTSKIPPLESPSELKKFLLENSRAGGFSKFKNFNQLPINFGLNQNIKIKDKTTAQRLEHVLKSFRTVPVKYSFAYGSKVFKQNNDNDAKQTDIIMAATFSDHFHSLNLYKNPNHYSFLRNFGSDFITKVQNLGPGVYFNPFVKVGDEVVKYGVVSIEKCVNDLLNWDNMYMAGRLHKPVKILRDDARMRFINQENLRNATAVSLLILLSKNDKSTFNITELFETIAGLSYYGDIRTKIGGENPNKVSNIVNNQQEEFRALYGPLLEIFENDEFISFTDSEKTQFTVNNSSAYKAFLVDHLPFNFKSTLFKTYFSSTSQTDPIDTAVQNVLNGSSRPQFHDIFKSSTSYVQFNNSQVSDSLHKTGNDEYLPSKFVLGLVENEKLGPMLMKTMADIVMYPSLVQSVKGIFTAGFSKSWNYAKQKRSKYVENK